MALFLSLAFGLPSPSFALRALQPNQDPSAVQHLAAGLEEVSAEARFEVQPNMDYDQPSIIQRHVVEQLQGIKESPLFGKDSDFRLDISVDSSLISSMFLRGKKGLFGGSDLSLTEVIRNSVDAIAELAQRLNRSYEGVISARVSRTEEGKWVIEITDNGTGIPTVILEEIARLRPVTTKDGQRQGSLGGSGSGTALWRGVVGSSLIETYHGIVQFDTLYAGEPLSGEPKAVLLTYDSNPYIRKSSSFSRGQRAQWGTTLRLIFKGDVSESKTTGLEEKPGWKREVGWSRSILDLYFEKRAELKGQGLNDEVAILRQMIPTYRAELKGNETVTVEEIQQACLSMWSTMFYILVGEDVEPSDLLEWLRTHEGNPDLSAVLLDSIKVMDAVVNRFLADPPPQSMDAFSLVIEADMAVLFRERLNPDIPKEAEIYFRGLVEEELKRLLPGMVDRLAKTIEYPYDLSSGLEESSARNDVKRALLPPDTGSGKTGLEEGRTAPVQVPVAPVERGIHLYVQAGLLDSELIATLRAQAIPVREFMLYDILEVNPKESNVFIAAVPYDSELEGNMRRYGSLLVNLYGSNPARRPQTLMALGTLIHAARQWDGLLRVEGMTVDEQNGLASLRVAA